MTYVNRERIMEDYNAAQRLLGMKRYEEAATYFDRCFDGCSSTGDTASCETILEELSKCYEKAGKFSDCIHSLGRLLNLVQAEGPTRRKAILHHNLGLLHEMLGNLPSAQNHFLAGSQVAGEAGDDRGQGLSLAMLAQVTAQLHDPAHALEILMRSINLLQRCVAPELEAVLEYADSLGKQSDPKMARKLACNWIQDTDTLRRFLDR